MLFTEVCVKQVVCCLADVCNVIFCAVFVTYFWHMQIQF
jgi:hypothetical protein